MNRRLERISSEIKKYDKSLYCAELPNGKPAVFRKTIRHEVHTLDEETKETLVVYKDSPHLVFPLTHNWSSHGDIVEWGMEPILARLRAMDIWQNENIVEDLIKTQEKAEQTKARDRRNNTESFLYEFRDKFKKDWSNINTASLAKKDRRYLDDKKIKGD
jgi:hypothetical protein